MGAEILDGLVIVPDLIGTLARQADVAAKYSAAIDNLSADDECRHGRLPTDKTPACGCWPQDAGPEPERRQLLHCANGDHPWTRPAKTRGRPPRSCPAHPRQVTR